MNTRLNILDNIKSLETLEEGWDGYSGKKISNEAILFVKKIIDKLPAEFSPHVFPMPNGGIQLEFDINIHTYIEVEIIENKASIFRLTCGKDFYLEPIYDPLSIIEYLQDPENQF